MFTLLINNRNNLKTGIPDEQKQQQTTIGETRAASIKLRAQNSF